MRAAIRPKSAKSLAQKLNMIRYVKGDATEPQAKGPKAIVHCCNDLGAWGAGFVMALSKKWPVTREKYLEWHRERTSFALGAIQLVEVRKDITVVNLIGQHGIRKGSKGPPARYTAIRDGLATLNKTLSAEFSIHMPRIGCGLAGGKWEKMEPIIEEALEGRDITVYDLG